MFLYRYSLVEQSKGLSKGSQATGGAMAGSVRGTDKLSEEGSSKQPSLILFDDPEIVKASETQGTGQSGGKKRRWQRLPWTETSLVDLPWQSCSNMAVQSDMKCK
jgi:hypothetical protein